VVGGDIDSPGFVEILTERSADPWLAGRFWTEAVVRLIWRDGKVRTGG
jgi:hypothetical protein